MARILIAEHNKTTAEYLQTTLKKAGNSVELVDNCLDAWRVSSQDHFDVLLVDIVMPGIDGFILAQKALQENPDIQIVFITGFAGVAMDVYATPSYSPAPVTSRPFHLKDIASRVRFLMGQGGLQTQSFAPERGDGNNVVYPDFSRAAAAQQQALT